MRVIQYLHITFQPSSFDLLHKNTFPLDCVCVSGPNKQTFSAVVVKLLLKLLYFYFFIGFLLHRCLRALTPLVSLLLGFRSRKSNFLSKFLTYFFFFFCFFVLHKLVYESPDVNPGQQSINVSMYGSADASALVAVARNMDVIQKQAEMWTAGAGNGAIRSIKTSCRFYMYSSTIFKLFNV